MINSMPSLFLLFFPKFSLDILNKTLIMEKNIRKEKLFEKIHKIEKERNEYRDVLSYIAFQLSVGLGDENTTAEQYKKKIDEGLKNLYDSFALLIREHYYFKK
jgi:hypothetical protein